MSNSFKNVFYNSIFLLIAWLLLILLAVSYFIIPESLPIFLIAGSIIIVGVISSFLDLKNGIFLIYPIILLGPICSINSLSSVQINFGDLYLYLIAIIFLLKRNKIFDPLRIFILPVVILFLCNLIITPNFIIALQGYVGFINFIIVFLLVLNSIKNREDSESIFISIGFASAIAASMHIYSFYQGSNMLLASRLVEGGTYILDSSSSYIKSSYFYSTFVASCITSLIICLYFILIDIKKTLPKRLFFAFLFLIVLYSSLLQAARTIFVSTFVVFLIMFFTEQSGIKSFFNKIIIMIFFGFLLIFGVPALLELLFSDYDMSLLLDNLYRGDAINISSGERFIYLGEFFNKIPSHLNYFLFGIGPDVPQRANYMPEVQSLMYSPTLDFLPYSFHNFYLDLIFQFGIIFALILFWFFIKPVLFLFKNNKINITSEFKLSIYLVLGWLILWFTHSTGWSKPVLALAEILGISYFFMFKISQGKI